MPQITSKERAALRAQSESLAKAKTLQRLQVGAQGITFNVLVSSRSFCWACTQHAVRCLHVVTLTMLALVAGCLESAHEA
jgi:hypothetical protein